MLEEVESEILPAKATNLSLLDPRHWLGRRANTGDESYCNVQSFLGRANEVIAFILSILNSRLPSPCQATWLDTWPDIWLDMP